MKTIGLPIACIVIAASCMYAPVSATTGSQESTVAGDKKPAVNFSGVMLTNQGEGFVVGNVTVNGLFKKIVAHRLPPDEYLDVKNKWLLIDPSAGGYDKTDHAEMDLAEIDTIEVPNAHAIWHYLKPDEQKKFNSKTKQPSGKEFIEIKVTKNDGNVFEYIIELSKKIKADTFKVLSPKEVDSISDELPAQAKKIVHDLTTKLAKKVRKTGKRKTSEETFFAYPSVKRLMIGDYVRRDDEEERKEKNSSYKPSKNEEEEAADEDTQDTEELLESEDEK